MVFWAFLCTLFYGQLGLGRADNILLREMWFQCFLLEVYIQYNKHLKVTTELVPLLLPLHYMCFWFSDHEKFHIFNLHIFYETIFPNQLHNNTSLTQCRVCYLFVKSTGIGFSAAAVNLLWAAWKRMPGESMESRGGIDETSEPNSPATQSGTRFCQKEPIEISVFSHK